MLSEYLEENEYVYYSVHDVRRLAARFRVLNMDKIELIRNVHLLMRDNSKQHADAPDLYMNHLPDRLTYDD